VDAIAAVPAAAAVGADESATEFAAPAPAEQEIPPREVQSPPPPAVERPAVEQELPPPSTNIPDSVPQVADSEPAAGLPDDPESAAPAAPAPPPEPEPEPVVLVCGAFGPFERGAEARALAESLASQGMETSLRRDSMEKPTGYWVMIPPLPSRQAAIEKVEQLRASGIDDVRRFVKGDQVNGISLGVFSTQKNAQSRQRAIADKGHRTSVVPRLVTVPAHWVDYRADQARVDKAVARIRENRDAVINEQYPCPRVVTSGGIF
jgi:type IV secretory pathway VirB10-like protein